VSALVGLCVFVAAVLGCGRINYDVSAMPPPPEVVLDGVAPGDRFGRAVAVRTNTALVGAPEALGLRGNAYAYRLDDGVWRVEEVVSASDGMPEDGFGGFVALSGDLAVLGADGSDDFGMSSGAAYVFRHEGSAWRELAKLTEPETRDFDYLGQTVSISGRRILVGCRYCSQLGESAGAAYLYEYDGTTLSPPTVLLASDGRVGDQFGVYVAISGEVAVVSKTADATQGSLYVYRHDGVRWNEEAILVAGDSGPMDELGVGVAMDGDRILAGAFRKDSATGAAYVFRRDGARWVEEQKLVASDAAPDSWFGRNVAISGDIALVGAPHRNGESGAAYVFRYDGARWVESKQLLADVPTPGDQFGYTVSVYGSTAGVGCPFDDENGVDSGAVYFYDLSQ
jgi:hypothetical protein